MMSEKTLAILFLCAASGFALSLVVGGATGKLILGVRIGALCFTAAFVALNGAILRSGRLRLGNLLEIERRYHPRRFHLAAALMASLTSGVCALFLALAFGP